MLGVHGSEVNPTQPEQRLDKQIENS
jgi:hypothetical protein